MMKEVVITLWCPMRFDFYPLDKQVTDVPGCMYILVYFREDVCF